MPTIQVRPCAEEDNQVYRCEEPEAMYFGVYTDEAAEGFFEWKADFHDRADAIAYAQMVASARDYTTDFGELV